MKKRIIVTVLTFTMVLAVSAQEIAKPPKPPKPPVEKMKDVPPPGDVPLPPPPPPPPSPLPPPVEEFKNVPSEYRLFLKKNATVSSLSWKTESVIIKLKSGNVERYNFNDAKSMKEAEAKYGKLPTAPPPPPPPQLPPPPPRNH